MSFTDEIYALGREGSIRSAEVIVPIAMTLPRKPSQQLDEHSRLIPIGPFPKRVVDVGCGEGWFAREFAKQGVPFTLGLDEYISELGTEEMVGSSVLGFRRFDLTQPIGEIEPFDLAVCLEVGEHLPEAHAETLVRSLAQLSPCILFSAAIPGQTGHLHINCQWPAYWVEKFNRAGFHVSGALRWLLWNDARVEPWYRQNLLVATYWPNKYPPEIPLPHGVYSAAGFAQSLHREGLGALLHEPYAVVHPDIWRWFH